MIKTLFNIAGTLALALAILGLFLPLLPTTPFLLLASACYLRGSERLHRWLLGNAVFGHYLANIQSGRGIPLRAKIWAMLFLWGSLALSAWYIAIPWVRIALLIPGLGVSVYLLHMKTLHPSQPQNEPASK